MNVVSLYLHTIAAHGSILTSVGARREASLTRGASCCDHPTWRNPVCENNHESCYKGCSSQFYRQCTELPNYKEVWNMCPQRCLDVTGLSHLPDYAEDACGTWCDVETPAAKEDCCDNPDFLFQNSPCPSIHYYCDLPEVQANCPRTCQTDPHPWNAISDEVCYDFCSTTIGVNNDLLTVPPTTAPPSTVPPTTVPLTTVPLTTMGINNELLTVPPTTAPPTTVPPTTVPPTTMGVNNDLVNATPPSNIGHFECPNGRVVDDLKIEYVHVQDFSASVRTRGSTISEELQRTFQGLHDAFGHRASFNLVRAIDKNVIQDDGTVMTLPCADKLLDEFTSYGDDELEIALDKFYESGQYLPNYARPDVLDGILHSINDWAGQGPTYNDDSGVTTVRLISVSVDQCPREAGHWFRLADSVYSSWAQDRGLALPLTGHDLPNCQAHDYPSVEEVATELHNHNVGIVWLVDSENANERCQDVERYPSEDQDRTIREWYNGNQALLESRGVKSMTRFDVETSQENLSEVLMASVIDLVCNLPTNEPDVTIESTEDPVDESTRLPTITSDQIASIDEEGDEKNVGVIVGSAVGGVLAASGAVVAALMVKGAIPMSGTSSPMTSAAEDVMVNTEAQDTREQYTEVNAEMFV